MAKKNNSNKNGGSNNSGNKNGGNKGRGKNGGNTNGYDLLSKLRAKQEEEEKKQKPAGGFMPVGFESAKNEPSASQNMPAPEPKEKKEANKAEPAKIPSLLDVIINPAGALQGLIEAGQKASGKAGKPKPAPAPVQEGGTAAKTQPPISQVSQTTTLEPVKDDKTEKAANVLSSLSNGANQWMPSWNLSEPEKKDAITVNVRPTFDNPSGTKEITPEEMMGEYQTLTPEQRVDKAIKAQQDQKKQAEAKVAAVNAEMMDFVSEPRDEYETQMADKAQKAADNMENMELQLEQWGDGLAAYGAQTQEEFDAAISAGQEKNPMRTEAYRGYGLDEESLKMFGTRGCGRERKKHHGTDRRGRTGYRAMEQLYRGQLWTTGERIFRYKACGNGGSVERRPSRQGGADVYLYTSGQHAYGSEKQQR